MNVMNATAEHIRRYRSAEGLRQQLRRRFPTHRLALGCMTPSPSVGCENGPGLLKLRGWCQPASLLHETVGPGPGRCSRSAPGRGPLFDWETTVLTNILIGVTVVVGMTFVYWSMKGWDDPPSGPKKPEQGKPRRRRRSR